MEHLSKKKFSYLKQEQLTNEQKVVLEKLCNLFGYKNCKFLEIGSCFLYTIFEYLLDSS